MKYIKHERPPPGVPDCKCRGASTYPWQGVPVGRRHLSYHVYPVHGSVWRERVAHLASRWHLFDGRKVIAVAVDYRTDSADAVRAFLPADAEVFEVFNHPEQGETWTWAERWERILADAEDADAVYYGHAKGVTRPREPAYLVWGAACQEIPLHAWPLVEEHLRRYPLTGPFLRRHGMDWAHMQQCDWHYVGTHYWMRVGSLRSVDWQSTLPNRWFVEAWPGARFCTCQAGLLFPDAPLRREDLSRPAPWQVLHPAYVRWLAEHPPSP